MDNSRAIWAGVAAVVLVALVAVVLVVGGNDDDEATETGPTSESTSTTGPEASSTTDAATSTTEANTTTSTASTTETTSASSSSTTPEDPRPVEISFTFDEGAEGWEPGFADLPVDDREIYVLVGEWQELPSELGPGGGLFSSGQNRSDDLLMYWISPVEGLAPSAEYLVEMAVVLGTNQPSGLAGIGGSPTESVWVKAAASTSEPETTVDDDGFERLDLDIGVASQEGPDGRILGTIDNPDVDGEAGPPAPYAPLPLDGTGTGVTVEAGADGVLWLLIGIDSGFEGLTSVYVDELAVTLTPGS